MKASQQAWLLVRTVVWFSQWPFGWLLSIWLLLTVLSLPGVPLQVMTEMIWTVEMAAENLPSSAAVVSPVLKKKVLAFSTNCTGKVLALCINSIGTCTKQISHLEYLSSPHFGPFALESRFPSDLL